MAERAYAGVRVLDFTQGVAGPMACGLLAQFGADVVKVEPPGGDRMAAHPGYLAWNWLTMGQVLCLPMILGGIGLMVWAYRRQAAA